MKQNKHYQVCNKCCMDTTSIDISFDKSGICNYCKDYEKKYKNKISENYNNSDILYDIIETIKKKGKKKKYDCIVGVSGGVDSSWVLVKVKEFGLRPLAVHMDNGWNSELAQNNINNLVKSLGVDLYTHVIDWPEYRGLMEAFFEANVIDIELLYDNALLGVNYFQANRNRINYIIGGTNLATEGIVIPKKWVWYKFDKRNIKDIAKRFGNKKIKTFPCIGTLKYLYLRFIKKKNWISILDYMHYDKHFALSELEKKYGYKRYPYKHYESIFTRFYQGYILPKKFNVDKRRVHFSSLIVNNQMTRDEALNDFKNIPYSSLEDLENDKNYFIKKMDWSAEKLEKYLNRKSVCHSHYKSEYVLYQLLQNKIIKLLPSFVSKFLKRKEF